MITRNVSIGNILTIQVSGIITATGSGAPLPVPPVWSVDFPAIVSITSSGNTCIATAVSGGTAEVMCSSDGLTPQVVQIIVSAATTADLLVLAVN